MSHTPEHSLSAALADLFDELVKGWRGLTPIQSAMLASRVRKLADEARAVEASLRELAAEAREDLEDATTRFEARQDAIRAGLAAGHVAVLQSRRRAS